MVSGQFACCLSVIVPLSMLLAKSLLLCIGIVQPYIAFDLGEFDDPSTCFIAITSTVANCCRNNHLDLRFLLRA